MWWSRSQRSQRDLTKRSDETEIDWAIIEKQLVAWKQYFWKGKKLRIDISFHCAETGRRSVGSSLKKSDKRGPVSTTQRMLAERESQLDAEEQSSGQPSIWREVYSVMRCPGPPCNLGSYCWIDSEGKRHYKLKTHHLRNLIRYVERVAFCRLMMTSLMTFGNNYTLKSSKDMIESQDARRRLLPIYPQSALLTFCPVCPIRHHHQLHSSERSMQQQPSVWTSLASEMLR